MLRLIDLTRIHARPDARALDPAKVEAVAASIVDIGLLNPVRVRAVGSGFELIAGNHRVEACRSLGLAEIEAFVVEDDDLRAELAMIDENLCRSELLPSDRVRQTARRKVIYEDLHPEAKAGAVRARAANETMGHNVGDNLASTFSADTAKKTGQSERLIQRDAERGAKVIDEVLDLIRGTALDTGAYMDEIKNLPGKDQLIAARRDLAWERQKAREGAKRRQPNGARAIMASRIEPPDSLDYFPTPPWATRALIEEVLPGLGVTLKPEALSIADPACGEGHMTGVFEEYGFGAVLGFDIHDYSVEGTEPPGWVGQQNFLAPDLHLAVDWIITNPPFSEGNVDRTLEFALRATKMATKGVALFVRQQWLEGVERYQRLFRDNPPTLIAQFSERVNLCKGRWEPEGSTATAYVWLVWVKAGAASGTEFCWIEPGRRSARTRADDVERFTAHPVKAFVKPPATAEGGDAASSTLRVSPPDLPFERSSQGLLDGGPATGRPATSSRSADGPEGEGGTQRLRSGEERQPLVASSPADLNQVIREGYARDASIEELMRLTGLKRSAVKMRAARMNLSDPGRQRRAVSEANRRRAEVARAGA